MQPVLEQRPQRVSADDQAERGAARSRPTGPTPPARRSPGTKISTGTAGCTREQRVQQPRLEHRRRGPQHVGPDSPPSVGAAHAVAHVARQPKLIDVESYYAQTRASRASSPTATSAADRLVQPRGLRQVRRRAPEPRRARSSLGGSARLAAPRGRRAPERMSGASGRPGFSLMIRKRTTPSVMRSVRSRPLSSSGAAGVELQQVVLGARLAVDRVGQRALAPLVVAQQLALRLDRRARVGDDLRARGVLGLRVEQQHEVVCGCGQRHARALRKSSGVARASSRAARALRADVGELLVDPVAGVARGDDLDQPARRGGGAPAGSIVSAA